MVLKCQEGGSKRYSLLAAHHCCSVASIVNHSYHIPFALVEVGPSFALLPIEKQIKLKAVCISEKE